MKNILFTTGGTGGHIYPALAIAKKMREKGINVIFVGTKHRMEKDLVPSENFKFIGLDILPLRSPISIIKMIKAIKESKKIIKENNIDAIVAFGNYISLPSAISGYFNKVPIYIQEQNIEFGMANKLLKKVSKKIFLAFSETINRYSLENDKRVYVTGNPLRDEFYSINKDNIKNRKKLLITGGSLGARNINEALIRNYYKLEDNEIETILLTGKNNYQEVISKISESKYLKIKAYDEDMVNTMNEASLVMCRSGALTISELIELEKPSILIPYDFVGQNENADMLVNANASYKYSNDKIDEAFSKVIEILNDENKLNEMKKNISKLNTGNAVENICNEILGDLNGN